MVHCGPKNNRGIRTVARSCVNGPIGWTRVQVGGLEVAFLSLGHTPVGRVSITPLQNTGHAVSGEDHFPGGKRRKNNNNRGL